MVHDSYRHVPEIDDTLIGEKLKNGETISFSPEEMPSEIVLLLGGSASRGIEPVRLRILNVSDWPVSHSGRLVYSDQETKNKYNNDRYTIDPTCRFLVVSEDPDLEHAQGMKGIRPDKPVIIGRDSECERFPELNNVSVSRHHIKIVCDEDGRLTIADTSTNGTQVKFMPDSPWDSLCEAPTGSPESSPSSDGLPSLVVPHDARFTSSLSSDGLPSLAVPHSPATQGSGELPSLIPRDDQLVGTELSPEQAEPSHDQEEPVEGKLRQMKELLEQRLCTVDFVEEQLKGALSALDEDNGDKLERHMDMIRDNASQLKAIATTGSDLLSVAPSSVVGSQVAELFSESQEKYNHLLEGLRILSTRVQTDSIDLGNDHWRVGFRQQVTEVNGLIKRIRAVDQELIRHVTS